MPTIPYQVPMTVTGDETVQMQAETPTVSRSAVWGQITGDIENQTDLQNLVNDARTTVDPSLSISGAAADAKKTGDLIAPQFSASTAFAIGDYCLYGGKLYKFTSAHTGAWSDADVEETEVSNEIESVRNEIKKFAPVYGAKWDRTSNLMTRTRDASCITTDTTNFVHKGSINANYSNPFDNIYPWSEMKVCDVDLDKYRAGTHSLKECIVSYYGDADFTYKGSDTVFVGRYRPEFWYKSEEDESGNIEFLISPVEREGFLHADEAIDGVGFVIDAGNSKVTCGSDVALQDVAGSTIHARAKASGFTLQDIFSIDQNIILYLVEFANMNSQNALGDGCSSCYRQNASDVIANVATANGVTTLAVPYSSALMALMETGVQLSFGTSSGARTYKAILTSATNDGTNITAVLDREVAISDGMFLSVHGFASCEFAYTEESVGNASGYIGTNQHANAYYRGVVLFGNRYSYVLGIYRQTATNRLWVCDNADPDDYDALNTSIHTDTGTALPDVAAAWLTVGNTAQRVSGLMGFLATGTSQGSSTSPVGDQQYVPAISAGNTVLWVCCYSSGGWVCGLFGGSWGNGAGASYWSLGALPLLKTPM